MKGYLGINIYFFEILFDDPLFNGFVKIHLNHMYFLCKNFSSKILVQKFFFVLKKIEFS